MEDNEIIALYMERNTDAILNTNDKYGSRLGNLAENILNSKEDAAECVNDTLFNAWNSIPPDRPQYLFAYLAKICRNLALNRLDWNNAKKRKAVIVELTNEMESCITDMRHNESETSEELGKLLNKFIKSLPEEKKHIFLRRYWYADSCRDIAVYCGCSESKVKVTLHRIRNELRKFLKREGIDI